jgi:hypothetical protein
VVRQRDFKLVSDEIMELSEAGLLVRPRLRILTGEELLLSFMAPYSRTFVDAEGAVARILHGRRLGDAGPAIGIAFTDIDEASRALLRRQLDELPTRMPQRRMMS